VVESAPNTFTQGQVDLQLNPLDNEVFIVQAVNLDLQPCDAVAGTDTSIRGTLTTTSQASMPSLSQSVVLAQSEFVIRAAGFVDGGVGFSQHSMDTPPTDRDWETL